MLVHRNVSKYEENELDFKALEIAIKKFEQEFENEKILVILNTIRIYGREALTLYGRDLLDRIRVTNGLYETPMEQNDDYYIIYAAIRAKDRGLILTNDHFSDHWKKTISKYQNVLKNWSEQQHIRFSFKKEPKYCINLKMPKLDMRPEDYYIQKLKNDSWLFPVQRLEKRKGGHIYWSSVKYLPDVQDEYYNLSFEDMLNVTLEDIYNIKLDVI